MPINFYYTTSSTPFKSHSYRDIFLYLNIHYTYITSRRPPDDKGLHRPTDLWVTALIVWEKVYRFW